MLYCNILYFNIAWLTGKNRRTEKTEISAYSSGVYGGSRKSTIMEQIK